MKLAASNIGWRAEYDQTAWQLLHTYGYTGLEAAPTRLVPAPPYGRAADAAALARKLRADYGLCIPSLQSIWYGRSGNLFDPADAPALIDYTEQAAAFAAAVGCKSLVFGCPRGRVMPAGGRPADAIPFFSAIVERRPDTGSASRWKPIPPSTAPTSSTPAPRPLPLPGRCRACGSTTTWAPCSPAARACARWPKTCRW